VEGALFTPPVYRTDFSPLTSLSPRTSRVPLISPIFCEVLLFLSMPSPALLSLNHPVFFHQIYLKRPTLSNPRDPLLIFFQSTFPLLGGSQVLRLPLATAVGFFFFPLFIELLFALAIDLPFCGCPVQVLFFPPGSSLFLYAVRAFLCGRFGLFSLARAVSFRSPYISQRPVLVRAMVVFRTFPLLASFFFFRSSSVLKMAINFPPNGLGQDS